MSMALYPAPAQVVRQPRETPTVVIIKETGCRPAVQFEEISFGGEKRDGSSREERLAVTELVDDDGHGLGTVSADQ